MYLSRKIKEPLLELLVPSIRQKALVESVVLVTVICRSCVHLNPFAIKVFSERLIALHHNLVKTHSNTPFKNPVSSDRSVPKGFVVLGEQLFDSLHGFHSHAPSCFNENEISVLKSFIVGVQHCFDSLNGFHIRFSFRCLFSLSGIIII